MGSAINTKIIEFSRLGNLHRIVSLYSIDLVSSLQPFLQGRSPLIDHNKEENPGGVIRSLHLFSP